MTDKGKEILLKIDSSELSTIDLISIFEISASKMNINSIQGMAGSENKTYRGIKISKKYRKILIGTARLVVEL